MSNSESTTTNDIRVATMLLQKVGETFQDLQSHSYSIITLGEQWKRLQSSIGKIHSSIEEKVKAVESKDREIHMNRIRLQNFKKDVENRQKNLEIQENSLKQRIEDVEMREKQVKEWCEFFELQKREIAEQIKAVKVCEKRNSEGLERVKAVDVAEIRVSERRKAVEERENEVEERRKAVEERENAVDVRWKAVEERENEVLAREAEAKAAAAEKVGLREGMMNERRDELEAKEVKLKEFEEEVNRRFVVLEKKEEELGLTEKEIDELYSAVRLKEEENEERSKMLEKKEKEIDERYQVLEGKELELELIEKEKDELFNDVRLKEKEINEMREKYLKEFRLRENGLNERIKEVEMREEEVNVKIDAFEVKVAQIDGVCKGVEVKCREMKATMMDDRCRELDCREKMLNERGKELTSSAQVKTTEPPPVACSEIQLLCRNMDANGMRSYLIKLRYQEIYKMRDKMSDYLQLSPDPAKLVLNVIQSLYELLESESMPIQAYIACCITLSAALLLLNTSITPCLKDDAMKFSIMWRDFFAKKGYTHRLDKYAFLQFLATYELAQSYDADELFSHLGAFYTESEVLWPRQGLYLCRILGLEEKIPGFIKSLITREEKLQAVVYICAFKLEDDFPPVPLLKGHLECVKKRVQEMVKKGSDSVQNDAVNMELSALRALLKCISNFKLESSFSPAPLELRLKQLEKEMKGKANAETLLTVKKNISDSEMKGVALPGFDQSHLAIGKKRTLNSMESRNQGKIFKVNACQRSISKKPINLPATN